VIWGKPLGGILRADGTKPYFDRVYRRDDLLDPRMLDFVHRAVGNNDIYFVSNRENHPLTRDCVFRVTGKQPEIWDPVSGKVRDAAAFLQEDGCTVVPLEFAPFESYFVVFRKPIDPKAAGKAKRNFPKLSSCRTWPAPGRFTSIRAGVARRPWNSLNWSVGQTPEEGIKFYSGK